MSVQQAMALPIDLISIGLFLSIIAIELVAVVAGLHFCQRQSLTPVRSASQANRGQARSY